MEFRQLEYFCTISELRNFTRTAEALHVSQPSVTKAIKALENELELKLIDRSQKKVALTEAGRAFLLHAKRIMQEVVDTKQDMQRFCTHTTKIIRFGVPPMVEGYVFPDFFVNYSQAFPDVSIELQEFNDSKEVRERADTGDLDFGIVYGDVKEELANEMPIMVDSLSLCVAKNHWLSKAGAIDFAQLKNEKFILQQPNTYQNKTVHEKCRAAGFNPDVVLCTSQLKTIKQLVANGTGISVLPNFVTAKETNYLRKPFKEDLQVKISLYWGAGKIISSFERSFMDFMSSYIGTPEFKKHFSVN